MNKNNRYIPPVQFNYKKISSPYFAFLVFTASLYAGLFYCVYHAQLFAFIAINYLMNLLVVQYLKYGSPVVRGFKDVFFFLLGKTFIESFIYFTIGLIFYQFFGNFPFAPIIMLLFLFILRYTVSDTIKYYLFDGFSMYKTIKKSYRIEFKENHGKKNFVKFSGTILGIVLFIGAFLLKEKSPQYLPIVLGICISFLILFFFEPVTKNEEKRSKRK